MEGYRTETASPRPPWRDYMRRLLDDREYESVASVWLTARNSVIGAEDMFAGHPSGRARQNRLHRAQSRTDCLAIASIASAQQHPKPQRTQAPSTMRERPQSTHSRPSPRLPQ